MSTLLIGHKFSGSDFLESMTDVDLNETPTEYPVGQGIIPSSQPDHNCQVILTSADGSLVFGYAPFVAVGIKYDELDGPAGYENINRPTWLDKIGDSSKAEWQVYLYINKSLSNDDTDAGFVTARQIGNLTFQEAYLRGAIRFTEFNGQVLSGNIEDSFDVFILNVIVGGTTGTSNLVYNNDEYACLIHADPSVNNDNWQIICIPEKVNGSSATTTGYFTVKNLWEHIDEMSVPEDNMAANGFSINIEAWDASELTHSLAEYREIMSGDTPTPPTPTDLEERVEELEDSVSGLNATVEALAQQIRSNGNFCAL